MVCRVIVGGQGATYLSGEDAVLTMVVHGEVGSDEEGDIAARLIREVAIDIPEVGSLRPSTFEGSADIAWATVVGSEDEPPVTVDTVEILEEAAGSSGTLHGIHTFVDEAIDGEAVDLPCREHQLP